MILDWLKAHVGVIFMGIAGSTVTALTQQQFTYLIQQELVLTWVQQPFQFLTCKIKDNYQK